jgi:hypothetical protein
VTDEEIKNECFNKAWNNVCEGSCEEHRGECSVVYVDGWTYFSYCEEAIAEDRRRGLSVNVLNAVQTAEPRQTVEDTRSPARRAKDELGFPMEDRGR